MSMEMFQSYQKRFKKIIINENEPIKMELWCIKLNVLLTAKWLNFILHKHSYFTDIILKDQKQFYFL